MQRVIGNNADAIVHQEHRHIRAMLVAPDQHRYLTISRSGLMHLVHSVQNLLHLTVLVAENDLDTSVRAVFRLHKLPRVRIYVMNLEVRFLTRHPIENQGSIFKKTVVELDYIPEASVVAVKGLHFAPGKFSLHLARHHPPVGAAPAVDALLHVTHQKVLLSLRDTVLDERAEIVPLNPGRVLKFVQQKMLEPHSQLLVDERSVRAVDYIPQNHVGIVQTQHILLLHQRTELSVQISGNSQFIQNQRYF